MKTHTTVKSWGAIALGLMFTGVTAFVLLEDVLHGAAIGTGHALTVAAIIGTITAGHMAWPHLRAGRVVGALGLCALFVAGTVYVVVSAGARNAEVQASKAEAVRQHNADRLDLVKQVAEARQRLGEAQQSLSSECKSGKGKRCEGVALTVDERGDRLSMLEAKLRIVGPAQAENAGYAHAARVFAAFPLVSAGSEAIEARLTLLMPFLLVLVAELGTLVFWSVAFETVPMRSEARSMPVNDNPPADRAPVLDVPPVPDLTPTDRDRVLNWADAFRVKHGRFPTQAEIRDAMELPKTTVWRLYHELGLAA